MFILKSTHKQILHSRQLANADQILGLLNEIDDLQKQNDLLTLELEKLQSAAKPVINDGESAIVRELLNELAVINDAISLTERASPIRMADRSRKRHEIRNLLNRRNEVIDRLRVAQVETPNDPAFEEGRIIPLSTSEEVTA